MSRFRQKFIAALLLAFWLLATQHCGLEAAGLFDSHAEPGSGCCKTTDSCLNDGCQEVESGGFRLDTGIIKIASPQLTAGLCLFCVAVVVPEPELRTAAPRDLREQPLDWVPTWQFVQRAALSPRAPSSVLA